MHRLLDDERIAAYEGDVGRERIKRAAETLFGRVRLSAGGVSFDSLVESLARDLERLRLTSFQRPVINATGIILHTNLGRAPLGADALAAVAELGGRYSNLEYDLETGERGSRNSAIAEVLRDVTGAEDGLVVNNCAAAVLLVLDTFAKGHEVVVARNQLVEIGGGFRIPDVLERSGAALVEVGTTNRVYIEDFERALSPRTALILRTHASNYRMEGFVHEPAPTELTDLGRRAGVPVVEDLGSGALVDLAEYGIAHERTVQEAVNDGISLVTFSGDKLLGGPQAGIIVGRNSFIARLKSNPLLRALRVGKLTLAALDATLRCYRNDSARDRLPVLAMLAATLGELRDRAQAYGRAIPDAAIVDSDAYAGGGASPESRIPSIAIAAQATHPNELAARLRCADPAIVARIERGSILLNLRTILPASDAHVVDTLARQFAKS
jgi:L-seryl-tRNA(Ser) seleniumtransferase